MERVNSTRMEFTRLRRGLATAIRGYELLKDKRDELMCQLLDLVRENRVLREKVEAGIAAVNQNFVPAHSGMTDETLNVALMAPKQEVYLEAETKNTMSVEILVFKHKTRTSDPNDIYSYSFVFTSSDPDDTVGSLTDLLSGMLRPAGCEKFYWFMVAEIERARHRVGTLGHVMISDTQSNIRYIIIRLDENERSSQTRFMKAKDMTPEGVHHYSEREAVPVVDEV